MSTRVETKNRKPRSLVADLARQSSSATHRVGERAISSVVAQQLYTLLVGGSNPSSPTIRHRKSQSHHGAGADGFLFRLADFQRRDAVSGGDDGRGVAGGHALEPVSDFVANPPTAPSPPPLAAQFPGTLHFWQSFHQSSCASFPSVKYFGCGLPRYASAPSPDNRLPDIRCATPWP